MLITQSDPLCSTSGPLEEAVKISLIYEWLMYGMLFYSRKHHCKMWFCEIFEIFHLNIICDSLCSFFLIWCFEVNIYVWNWEPAVLFHPSCCLTLEWTSVAADCSFISPWIVISVGRSCFHQSDLTHTHTLQSSLKEASSGWRHKPPALSVYSLWWDPVKVPRHKKVCYKFSIWNDEGLLLSVQV